MDSFHTNIPSCQVLKESIDFAVEGLLTLGCDTNTALPLTDELLAVS